MTRAKGNALASNALIRPFQRFFRMEAASGILLLGFTILALVWANSPLAPSYFALWKTRITVDIGGLVTISKPFLLWINDGLMAIFFFLVGLEIKREVTVGELSDRRNAALSVAAAIGGMVFPALVYATFNAGGPGSSGWAIPTATDIAFALGVLALLGKRVPLPLKVFVTAVAIVDDLGAVLVIAFFYTENLAFGALGIGAAVLVTLVLLNLAGVRRTWPYAALGVVLWVAFLKSGVHATIAGVLLALTIPARRLIDAPEYVRRAENLLASFRSELRPGVSEPSGDQLDALHALEEATEELEPPLQRLEHALHPWAAWLIIPVFALANAGVQISGGIGATIASPVSLGIVLGLLLGKQAGIVTFSWLAVRSGVAALPAGVSWVQLWGVGLLCGIGFTMSLFIASLAFTEPAMLDAAKIGILGGSLLSGIAGSIVLARAARGRG